MNSIDDELAPPVDSLPSRSANALNTRFVAIGVMFTLVLVAGLGGAAVDRMLHKPQPGMHGPGPDGRGGPDGGRRGGPGGPGGRGGGRGGPRPLDQHLTGELALTPAQRTAIDSAMALQLNDFESTRKSIQPRLDSILQITRKRIEAILTPAQRAALPPAQDGRGPDFGPMPGMRGDGFRGRGGPGGRGGPDDRRGPPDGRGGRDER